MYKNNPTNMNRLMKVSKKDRRFLGVCGGISKYLNGDLDPVIIRLIWSLLCFFSPFMIIFYFIMTIILPTETEQQ